MMMMMMMMITIAKVEKSDSTATGVTTLQVINVQKMTRELYAVVPLYWIG